MAVYKTRPWLFRHLFEFSVGTTEELALALNCREKSMTKKKDPAASGKQNVSQIFTARKKLHTSTLQKQCGSMMPKQQDNQKTICSDKKTLLETTCGRVARYDKRARDY